MKSNIIYILLFSFYFSFSQREYHDSQIDSIHKNLIDSKASDSTIIARGHFLLGEIYRKRIPKSDSAFFHYIKAEKIYKSLNSVLQLAISKYGIAVVQKNEKDFTGSEQTSIEALSLLSELKQTESVRRYISYIYNNLGLVFGELGQFEQSIDYYKKALEIKEGLKGNNKITINNSKNNIALSYKKSGQLDLALDKYSEILEDKDLISETPDFYALVLNNYAHTLFLKDDYSKLPGLYFKALKATNSVNLNGYNSIIINQHIASYYYKTNNVDSARHYAYKAKSIAEEYSKDELLTSILLLSEIEEGNLAMNHLRDYVKLNDSLQKSERAKRDKFARIRFETKQIEQENEQIAKERTWLLIISVVVIITSFLLYLVVNQRNKNKELQFIQKQQETNEEIYNLMLSQNESIEEARTLEKKRISEELHDGVLGRLFGTRLSLDSLNMNNSPEAIKARGDYIIQLKSIEEDIRKVSHELNTDFVSGGGFIDIIKTLVETQSIAYKLTYELDYDDIINWDLISNKKKIHIYRIIQETLHNIYKHAKATHVNISFKSKKGVICLTMTDNGSGFDVNKAKSGIGLKNMNSRINDISGTLNITSKKDAGTTVNIEVPV